MMKTRSVQNRMNTDEIVFTVESSIAAETSGITKTVIAIRTAKPIAAIPIILKSKSLSDICFPILG